MGRGCAVRHSERSVAGEIQESDAPRVSSDSASHLMAFYLLIS
ncbi:hypothetical protein IJ22_01760 [Paenibacillus naphthalenovorans]|uniref:Uncharacterized protein n=1 Tax=Paenibacillus naphthalenovorans TaxID=162209 RepID=A0A0U2U2M6_9BACL|nr:hypothetical protein IJ22_01760 [Paenibacillus naphthalenovorans]